MLFGFASISTDLYMPALPAMAAELGASDGVLQWTHIRASCGIRDWQLFSGPLSDRYGRTVPVVLDVLVFVIGSAGRALSTDAWQILGWHVVQAHGSAPGWRWPVPNET